MDKEKTGGKWRMKRVSQKLKKEKWMKQSRAPEVRDGIKQAEE